MQTRNDAFYFGLAFNFGSETPLVSQYRTGAVNPPSDDLRITEDGQTRITEDGQTRITE